MEIAQLGQPILRQPAKPVPLPEIASDSFQEFIEEMLDTMRQHRGVGLAAPQVFAGRRVFLAAILPPARPKEKPGTEVFINPRLSNLSEEKDAEWEGCLSFLELLVLVPRHRTLQIDYLDRHGEPRSLKLSDFPARVVQHEYDHLDGILTIDRAASPRDIVKASEIDAVREERGEKDDE